MVNGIHSGGSINRIYQKQKAELTSQQKESVERDSLAPFNNAYVTPFINVQKSNFTKNELNFINYRDKFCEVFGKVSTEYNKASWNFDVNCSEESANTLNIMNEAYSNIFNDREAYEKFKGFNEKGLKDKHLNEQIKYLLGNFETVLNYSENQNTNISSNVSENDIMQVLNSFKSNINGKTVSDNTIFHILNSEKDLTVLRKKAYYAKFQAGDAVADQMLQLVRQRNEIAHAAGYKNFYAMELERYGTSEEKLFKLLDDLNEKSDPIYQKIKQKKDADVCKNFGIAPEQIEPHHYYFKNSESLDVKVNQFFSKNMLMPAVTKLYNDMGWQIDKMPIETDLFPRENKNGYGMCYMIEAGKDVRISANLCGNEESMRTLTHEVGHAVYGLGIKDTLPFLDKNYASEVMTEAVAILAETLPAKEGAYTKLVGMPENLNNELESSRLEGLACRVKEFIFYSQFEKQLYENPEQDIPKLWYDLVQKYMGYNPPEEMHNEWATVQMFLTHPAYTQNYMRAIVMSEQIYDSAREKLGGNLSDNKDTAKFFEDNIFQYGCSKTEDEILKIVSGKELSSEAFCKQLEKIK